MSQHPRETRIPRPVSSADLIRKASALTLRHKSSVATLAPTSRRSIITQPSASSPLSAGLKPITGPPKSRLGAVKSTLTLRRPASNLSLRPSRPLPPAHEGGKGTSTEKVGSKTIRRIPSTNFKENYFNPPPPLPTVIRHDKPRTSLTKKKSQVFPSIRKHHIPAILAKPIKRESLDPFGPHRQSTTAAAIPSPKIQKSSSTFQLRPNLTSKRAPMPVFTPTPNPVKSRGPPTSLTMPDDKIPSSVPFHPPFRAATHLAPPPTPLTSNLGASPWKGPRLSTDQIKDVEYSFTEDTSIEVACLVEDVEQGDQGSRWLSGSIVSRPRSRAITYQSMAGSDHNTVRRVNSVADVPLKQAREIEVGNASSQPPFRSISVSKIAEDFVAREMERTALEILKEKDREIEMLKMESRAERQILGRVGRESTEREEVERRKYELEKSEMEEHIWDLRQQSVVDKYSAVEVAAEEAQRDIESQREMIRRLRKMLDI